MSDPTSMATPAAITILALDLGKFKSVACRYDAATGAHAFQTIATTPPAVHDLLIEAAPSMLVIEARAARAGGSVTWPSRCRSRCAWPTRWARRGGGSG